MIQNLATAVEKDPFNMKDGARYLRNWVTESMVLSPAVDVSFICSAATLGSLDHSQRMANPHPQAVALEPAVGQVRVEAGRFATNGTLQNAATNPKMDVIGGIAESFRSEGLTWEDSFDKAFKLWDKLNASLQSALTFPPNPPDANAPVVVENQGELEGQPIEDDSAVLLQEEASF